MPCHSHRTYCSPACRYLATRKHARATLTCATCGKVFVVPVTKTQAFSNLYCSWACRNKGLRITRLGPNNPAWRGGVSPPNQADRKSVEYDVWRDAVFRRDNYTCQHCGARGRMHAHHILSYAGFPERRYDVVNGITLCVACHGAVHGRVFYR
jgi:hypothetical protein